MTARWQPSLLLPDDALFSRRLSAAARVVLGVTLGYPNRNPSLTQLQEATGLLRLTIIEAQNELEEARAVWIEEEDDTLTESAWSFVEYDRPVAFHDRHPGSHRFNRSNKVVAVECWANPHHPMNAGRWTELPGSILARLPGGTKNTALIRLVALAYAREQLIRGAIQVEDKVLAARLGVAPAQVRRAREKLVAAGILVPYRRTSPATIYTMPGATPGRPESPKALDPKQTKRLRTLSVYVEQPVFATDAQHDHASRLIQRIGEPVAYLCLFSDASKLEPGEPGDVEPLLDLLANTAATPLRVLTLNDDREPVPIDTKSRGITDWNTLRRTLEHRDFYLLPLEPKNHYAAAPRDGLKTEEEPDLDAHRDDDGSIEPGEESLSDGEGVDKSAQRATAVPPPVAARLEELFPGRTHKLRRWVEWAIGRLDEYRPLWNAERRAIVENELMRQIELAVADAGSDRRHLYARLRVAVRDYIANGEDLRARLAAAPAHSDEPPNTEMMEVDVAALLAGS